MNTRLDPLAASDQITQAYQRYVKTFVDVRDPSLAAAFGRAVDHGNKLSKGPLLEATPAYAPGATLSELVNTGVLDPGFASYDSDSLPFDRPLYLHQEQAIRKVVNGRNVVVTTGTGSGKTESFLIPILNHLAKERAAGTLGPGVRALLLYPMNALANDQVKRLRSLLQGQTEISFGRYTGETKEDDRAAENQFRTLNPGATRLPNELISRQQMRAAPPHILLTNYAMLEYLLLRPLDMELFASTAWQFLALDEAHVYDGAKGAEIAMLLRRLHDRVAPDTRLQCIATSASLEGARSTVMKFATSLFGTDFTWIDESPAEQDMVTATRVTSPEVAKWGPLTPLQVAAIGQAPDVAAAVIATARVRGYETTSAADALHHEASVIRLRQRLSAGPLSVQGLARHLWPDGASPKQTLEQLVDIASGVSDTSGNPVLSARYHLFVRATEGAFTCLSDEGPHVQLGRHEECPDCEASCFEFGACRRCGAVYLAGQIENDAKKHFFRPSSRAEGSTTWLILGESDEVVDEDDEALDTAKSVTPPKIALLCAHCGMLNGANALSCDNCRGVSLRLVKQYERPKTTMASCSRCGARSHEVVRRLNMGADAPPSVLTTALYQQIPPASGPSADHLGEGRKLLLFSDSRQAAAFAAPYLQNTYGRLQERRLIVQGLERATQQGTEIGFRDLLFHTLAAATDAGFFGPNQTQSEREREVELWIMLELVSTDHRQSLEGLGLLGVSHGVSHLQPPPALLQTGLTASETWDLLDELVRIVRQQGVLSMPLGVAANDERFSPRLGPIYMRSNGSEPKRKVLSWAPTRGTNRRIAYLRRVLARVASDADAGRLLDGAWGFVERLGRFVQVSDKIAGTVAQVDYQNLRFERGETRTWYQCTLCRRISATSVRLSPAGWCTTRTSS